MITIIFFSLFFSTELFFNCSRWCRKKHRVLKILVKHGELVTFLILWEMYQKKIATIHIQFDWKIAWRNCNCRNFVYRSCIDTPTSTIFTTILTWASAKTTKIFSTIPTELFSPNNLRVTPRWGNLRQQGEVWKFITNKCRGLVMIGGNPNEQHSTGWIKLFNIVPVLFSK